MVTAARQVGELLHGLGIRRVYGLPGEDHMAVLDQFVDVGLEYRAAFNESSAVIMAATEAQLTGVPGVAVLSLAPGVSNGLNGLLNTFLDEVPLILISGQHPTPQLPLVVRQGFDIEHMVAPMTKWRARLAPGMDIAAVVGRAVDEAMSGRPGPVYLELPDAVATAEVARGAERTAGVVAALRQRWAGPSTVESVSSPAMVAGLAERLAQARYPALVVCGRRRRVSTATLDEFSAAFRLPVFTASGQKGALTGASPWYAGTFLNGRLERDLLGSSDLVLMLDPEAFDFYNRPWCFDAESVAIVEDDFSDWLNPFTERLVADPETLLRALLSGGVQGGSQWLPAAVADYRGNLRSRLLGVDSSTMSVAQAVDAALRAWPADGYLVADAGFSKPLVALLSEPSRPDHYLASNTLSTMGYAIPAATAARHLAATPLLAFVGDGSLLMRATELMVGRTGGAPTAVVAVMDGSLTQIEVKQERRSLATVGVSLPEISCARLADAFGIAGVDVDKPDDLSAAVAAAMTGPGITLIGAHVDPAPSRVLFDMLRG